MFLTSPGPVDIGGRRLEVRPDHRRNPALFGLTSDFRGGCIALPQSLLKPFDCDGQTDLAAMPEAIRHCFSGSKDFDANAFDHVRLKALSQ